jgi:hypothetical protein
MAVVCQPSNNCCMRDSFYKIDFSTSCKIQSHVSNSRLCRILKPNGTNVLLSALFFYLILLLKNISQTELNSKHNRLCVYESVLPLYLMFILYMGMDSSKHDL